MRPKVATAELRGRRDTGAASVEYVGALLITAVLILLVIAGVLASNPSIRENVEFAICKVFTLGLGDCGSGDDNAIDRVPTQPCIVSSEGGKVSLSVGLVAFGEGGEIWLIEKLGDGTYRVTEGIAVAGGAEGGAGGKVEVTINDQTYGGEAGLSGSAKVGIEAGNSYNTDTLEEAQDLLSRMRQQTLLQSGGPVGWLIDAVDGRDLPEPDSIWIEAGGEANGAAGVEAGIAGADAAGSIEAAVGTQINKDGSATVYLTGTISGEASAGIGVSLLPESKGKHAKPRELDFTQVAVDAGISGEAGVTVQVDYDDSGNATAVRTISTLGWSAETSAKFLGQGPDEAWGSTTDTTLELPLTSDADRKIAADMLAALGIPYVPGLSDGVRAPGLLRGVDAVTDAAYAFGQAARDHGRMWTDTYTHDESTKFGLEIEAALGGKVNVGGSWVSDERTGISQKYFDGIGFVEREGCAA